MTDIVQKLRAYRPRYGWPEEYSTVVEPTMNHVAADEIERLRAENERLRAALEKIIHEDLWTTKHPDGVTQRGESVFDGYFGGIARAALGEEK